MGRDNQTRKLFNPKNIQFNNQLIIQLIKTLRNPELLNLNYWVR